MYYIDLDDEKYAGFLRKRYEFANNVINVMDSIIDFKNAYQKNKFNDKFRSILYNNLYRTGDFTLELKNGKPIGKSEISDYLKEITKENKVTNKIDAKFNFLSSNICYGKDGNMYRKIFDKETLKRKPVTVKMKIFSYKLAMELMNMQTSIDKKISKSQMSNCVLNAINYIYSLKDNVEIEINSKKLNDDAQILFSFLQDEKINMFAGRKDKNALYGSLNDLIVCKDTYTEFPDAKYNDEKGIYEDVIEEKHIIEVFPTR